MPDNKQTLDKPDARIRLRPLSNELSRITVTYRSPTELTVPPNNPRFHPPRQIKQIARSISTFGFLLPIVVDEAEGHASGRREVRRLVARQCAGRRRHAARRLGATQIGSRHRLGEALRRSRGGRRGAVQGRRQRDRRDTGARHRHARLDRDHRRARPRRRHAVEEYAIFESYAVTKDQATVFAKAGRLDSRTVEVLAANSAKGGAK